MHIQLIMRRIMFWPYCEFWILATVAITISFHITYGVAEGIQCGQPGRPVNGSTSPTGKAYFRGEKVTYSCLEGFVLFGEEARTCLKNGTWSGEVPVCDFNLAKGKRTLQSDTLWSYNPALAVDGNGDTCSFTPRGPDPRWWQVHLGHKYNVVAIGVTISPGSFQEFTIFVIELLADNKALYKPCTTFKGVFQTHKGLFKCNDGLGHPGQFVYIRDDRQEEEYFGLCEVEVFAFRERIPCGDPEIPVHGEMTRDSEERASYSCHDGYTLGGDSSLTCSSKGQWQGQFSKCDVVKCPAPPDIKNGYTEIDSSSKADNVFGTEATNGCNHGYVLRGPSLIKCKPDGTWSTADAFCQVISCGDPPHFENARFTLLNDSTPRAGIAVYSCLSGFNLQTDYENTVTTCSAIGEWRTINVSCIPAVAHNFVYRQAQGRSLELETSENDDSSSQMVVALAVVAAVLAAGMIVFGILLVRKRLLSGPGSQSPLVHGIEKQSLPKDTSGGAINPTGTLAPYTEGIEKSTPSLYRTNLMQSDYRHEFPYADRSSDSSSLNEKDPSYERVHSLRSSDHSYETLGTKYRSPETSYESVSHDKDSIGYETVTEPSTEPGYETVAPVHEPGYEEVQHPCETKDAGYEILQEPSYEVVGTGSGRPIHGYETLKPKLPPPRDVVGPPPDILQNLSNPEVSPEILALYAKVDKTKKKKKKRVPAADTANGAKELIRKFSSLTSDEEMTEPTDANYSVVQSTIRPLPPLPSRP